jgi:pimeloyl-ACP methyl ester carboxylesterase
MMKLLWWQRLPLLAVGTYAAFCLALVLFQRRLLYFPQRLTEAQARRAFDALKVQRWPDPSGLDYRGVVKAAVAEEALTNGTVLVFHGNAGGAQDREAYCDVLQRLGWRVILAEYPGYAARKGAFGEVSFREDGRATARLIRQTHPGRLVILGESLGSGVAAAVAADPEVKADALILATPWDRLAAVAAHHYPWLPVRFFLRDRYDSIDYLKQYAGPVTILLSERDEIMPAACTLALYEGLPRTDRKRLVRIPSATHNDWFWLLSEEQWREILSNEHPVKGETIGAACSHVER